MLMTRNSDFRSLLLAARRRRWVMMIVFLAVFVVSMLVSLMLPPRFSSSMKILIRTAPSDLVAAPERADNGTLGRVSEAEVNSEVELLTSYGLIRSVVVKCKLDQAEFFFRQDDETAIDHAVRRLSKSLQVTPIRRANIIEVEYTGKSAALAASVLRAISEGYLEAHLRAQSTPGAYRFFSDQAMHYQEQLRQAQDQLAVFSRRENASNLEQQRTLLTQSVADQKYSLQQTEAARAQLQQEVSQGEVSTKRIAQRLVTQRRSIPNQYSVDHLTTLLAELNNRRAMQISKFRDDDEFIKETDSEIAQTKRALELANSALVYEEATDVNPVLENVQAGLETRRVELAGLLAKEGTLRQQISTNTAQLNQLTDMAGEFDALSLAVQRFRENYNEYAKRREEARVSELLDQSKITNVVVTQPPTESSIPAQSHFFVNLLLSFVLASCSSIIAALVSERAAVAAQEQLV